MRIYDGNNLDNIKKFYNQFYLSNQLNIRTVCQNFVKQRNNARHTFISIYHTYLKTGLNIQKSNQLNTIAQVCHSHIYLVFNWSIEWNSRIEKSYQISC
jgi:hypothetical protein